MSKSQSKQNLLKRTAKLEKELAAKGYGLKIEAALEKVSIAAMSMRSSKDLSGIGSLIFKQLKKLGFPDLRNTEIVINNDARETITSYYYSDYGVTGVIELDYRSNPIVHGWAKKSKKASDAFAKVIIREKEIKQWRKYREEIGYQPDPKLNTVKTVYYYSYSIGLGALSISSFKPVSKEQLEVLGRFRNVFNLSYRRYADITLAETQAREAQIELALERVRAKTMAMKKSEELQETTLVLFQQFKSLGVTAAQVSICVFDEDAKMGEMFVTLKGEKIDRSFSMELDKEVFVMKKAKKAFLEKQKRFSFTVKGKELQEYNRWRNSLIDKKGWDESKAIRKQSWYVDGVFFSRGLMGISSNTPVTAEASKLLERFAVVFDLTFTRFLDLQKAEAQAREAKIEASLERVRGRSMAMHDSSELHDVIKVVTEQLSGLGIKFDHANFSKIDVAGNWDLWISTPEQAYPSQIHFPYFDHRIFNQVNDLEKTNLDFFTELYSAEEKNIFFRKFFEATEARNIPEERKQYVLNDKGMARSFFRLKNIWFSMGKYDDELFTDEENNIFRRFAIVFEQSYTRFLDLQKAEAQAREAQVEAALERVRGKTMVMHSSQDVAETVAALFVEFVKLGIETFRCGIGIMHQTKEMEVWTARPNASGKAELFTGRLDMTMHPLLQGAYSAWEHKEEFYTYELKEDDLITYFTGINKNPKYTQKYDISSLPPRLIHSEFYFPEGTLFAFSLERLSAETSTIFKRFAAVFGQTYRRFLDLQKAEAHAREAEIELGLERVRARAMAMHGSEELKELVKTLFEELIRLDVDLSACLISTFDISTLDERTWMFHPVTREPYVMRVPYNEQPFYHEMLRAWKERNAAWNYCLEGETKVKWHDFLFADTEFALLPQAVIDEMRRPDKVFFTASYYSYGAIQAASVEPFPAQSIDIIQRFSKVFDLSYTRFLDLQKAEAQAREAQIQLSLERVRAKAMAMHSSDDLNETIKVFYQQISLLSLKPRRCGVGLFNKENRMAEVSVMNTSEQGESIETIGKIALAGHPVLEAIYEHWLSQQDYFPILRGNQIKEYYQLLRPHLNYPDYPHDAVQYGYFFYFNEGTLYAWTTEALSEEELKIYRRFNSVLSLTYKRYKDLKQAEENAREAQIEAALERVRGKTMAMHNSQDVGETVATMFAEFVHLGIHTNRCGILIFNDEHVAEVWTARSTPGGSAKLIIGKLDLDAHKMLTSVYNAWKAKETFYQYDLLDDDLVQYYTAINNSKFYPTQFDLNALPSKEFHSDFFFRDGAVFSFTNEPVAEEHAKIIKRFALLFGQTYRRYLDLQKAEAQTRESQIQLSLERVRARTMAMHKSEELAEVAEVLYNQLKDLGDDPERITIGIMSEDNRVITWWATDQGGSKLNIRFQATADEPTVMLKLYNSWKAKHTSLVVDLTGTELSQWVKYCREVIGVPINEEILQNRRVQTAGFFSHGCVMITSPHLPDAETINILERFTTVFDLTYRRFLDLQKAEAQAKEAQIETSLERVRSKTMAMHSSDDVTSATATMFTELERLGIENMRCGIAHYLEDHKMEVWSVSNLADGKVVRGAGLLDTNSIPFWKIFYSTWQKKEDFLYYLMAGKEKEDYFRKISTLQNYLSRSIEDVPDLSIQTYYFPEGSVWAFSLKPHSEEDKQVMKRFASVFSLTFRRYQDLKNAEAQAREATIEAAMEKVRSSAMAMHSSNDISSTTTVVFEELRKLNIHSKRCGVALLSKDSHTCHVYAAATSSDGKFHTLRRSIEMTQHRSLEQQYESWIKQENYVVEMTGEELRSYYQLPFFYSSPDYAPPMNYEQTEYGYYIPFSEGLFYAWTEEPYLADEINVLNRFKRIVDLTFRRYFDLQKAEAQAREATIEAALEKVRGKAMAMHNSNDLSVTASMVFTELRKLGINPIRCGVGLLNKESRKAQLYSATSSADGDSLSLVGWAILSEHPVLEKIYQSWMDNEEYYPELQGEQMRSYYQLLLKGLPVAVPQVEDDKRQCGTFLPFSVGCLYAWSEAPYDEAEIKVLKRFATIIDLTFRRYLELQKSEANAREAVKQAAVDRIRADIASMRTIGDLDRITPLIWNELTILGLPFIRCGVFIMDNSQKLIHTFLSTPDGKAIGAFHLPYDTPGSFADMVIHWENKKTFITHWGETDMMLMADVLVKQGAIATKEQYLRSLPGEGFYLHFLPFLQGMLYVANLEKLNEEQIELIQHVADAFSTAYARYEDFNKLEAAKQQVEKTLTDLKQAQTQLVQSEKMASLGELTAGIAHEIQNPLNFVNNFSDVSNELLEEMKEELAKGNIGDAIAIAEDVKQNLEKINHHGKRADGIVKGMLQHSRTSSGQKEMTDINVLADEYLRLAYHGLRAKEKSFNAKFETSFDKNVGEINIIPQDIGRVILNLINNAFYAVSEKKKQGQDARLTDSVGQGYEPTVTLTTVKDNGRIEIKVKDNGNGIPQKVLDKIFQPFFTTKPTGQGTGLGLSLAYDIVKAHGGDIRVETKEGEGTEFIIQLPVI